MNAHHLGGISQRQPLAAASSFSIGFGRHGSFRALTAAEICGILRRWARIVSDSPESVN
jgi:hypothetical protein